jgi:hypothetical protein
MTAAAKELTTKLGSGVMMRGLGATLLRDGVPHGRAVQVDPIKFTLKAPGTERMKLKYG